MSLAEFAIIFIGAVMAAIGPHLANKIPRVGPGCKMGLALAWIMLWAAAGVDLALVIGGS